MSSRLPRPLEAGDPLLAGLLRLKSSPPSATTSATPPLPSPRRTRRSAPALNVPYAYFPTLSTSRVAWRPSALPRADWLEQLERSTGLCRAGAGDLSAAERLLRWVLAGVLDPAELLRAVVAGSTPADARMNAYVLAVVAWLCIAGGPAVLPAAVYVTSTRKPSPALRVCLDVLRSLGAPQPPEELLYDDNLVRQMRLPRVGDDTPQAAPQLRAGRRLSQADAALAAAVEAYALSTGRKLVFHHRYPEVEANYSLDRYFRKMHIENRVDAQRDVANMERHSLVISRVSLAEVALITHCAVVAADRLERAQAPQEIAILALAEACNAYSFSEYVRLKIAESKSGDIDLDEERACLAGMVLDVQRRGGSALRKLKRFVEAKVLAAITDTRRRPTRSESKHRREVLCTFTSFESLHRALAPSPKTHSSDIAA